MLVEDNPADVRLTEEALRDVSAGSLLTVANDGIEALSALFERLVQKAPLPDIVLLDLNLPRMNGREVLERIKADVALKHIPVIVLTTSYAEQDVLRSYDLGANAFINKSVDLDQFLETMRAFATFWLGSTRLWRA